MTPACILPTRAPQKPSSSTVVPPGNGLPQEDPTLLPSGEILKSNWITFFPDAPKCVGRPPIIPTPAAQPLEPAAAVHAVLQSSCRQEETTIKDEAMIVPPPPTATVATGGGYMLSFDREFSMEDDPAVMLPNKEEGCFLDDDETPPLPTGIDWWSPPREN